MAELSKRSIFGTLNLRMQTKGVNFEVFRKVVPGISHFLKNLNWLKEGLWFTCSISLDFLLLKIHSSVKHLKISVTKPSTTLNHLLSISVWVQKNTSKQILWQFLPIDIKFLKLKDPSYFILRNTQLLLATFHIWMESRKGQILASAPAWEHQWKIMKSTRIYSRKEKKLLFSSKEVCFIIQTGDLEAQQSNND